MSRFSFFAWLLVGCGVSDPCPEVSMLDGPAGLRLTREEHVDGWAQEECFGCHNEGVLHRTGCTPDVDLERISERVEAEGVASCEVCHGDNGVFE